MILPGKKRSDGEHLTVKMPREPKKDEEKKPVRSAEDDEVENEPKVRSYYYDDAHGYEDYEPAEDRMEDEEEVTERTPES